MTEYEIRFQKSHFIYNSSYFEEKYVWLQYVIKSHLSPPGNYSTLFWSPWKCISRRLPEHLVLKDNRLLYKLHCLSELICKTSKLESLCISLWSDSPCFIRFFLFLRWRLHLFSLQHGFLLFLCSVRTWKAQEESAQKHFHILQLCRHSRLPWCKLKRLTEQGITLRGLLQLFTNQVGSSLLPFKQTIKSLNQFNLSEGSLKLTLSIPHSTMFCSVFDCTWQLVRLWESPGMMSLRKDFMFFRHHYLYTGRSRKTSFIL